MGWNGPMTHRQFQAWQVWLDEDMGRPGKLEHYVMQNACEVRRVLSKKPNDVKLDDFRLKFVPKKRQPTSQHAQNVASMAKMVWMKRMNSRVIELPPVQEDKLEAVQQDYQE